MLVWLIITLVVINLSITVFEYIDTQKVICYIINYMIYEYNDDIRIW